MAVMRVRACRIIGRRHRRRGRRYHSPKTSGSEWPAVGIYFIFFLSALRLYLAPTKNKNTMFWICCCLVARRNRVCVFRICAKKNVRCQQLIELKRWRLVNPLATECRSQSSGTPYIICMYSRTQDSINAFERFGDAIWRDNWLFLVNRIDYEICINIWPTQFHQRLLSIFKQLKQSSSMTAPHMERYLQLITM